MVVPDHENPNNDFAKDSTNHDSKHDSNSENELEAYNEVINNEQEKESVRERNATEKQKYEVTKDAADNHSQDSRCVTVTGDHLKHEEEVDINDGDNCDATECEHVNTD
eukprot:GFUD01088136.1.p1 GENE.GFUD01088136.1~~GFUD01088136.1.p1  ORF type:complete len:126 (+),score=55.37 GFUD01088136.1:54-380(+)